MANPSQPSQPLRSTTGGKYGQAKKLTDAQRAVPLRDETNQNVSSQHVYDAAKAYSAPTVGLGAPTQRPGEPVTAGIGTASPAVPQGPNPDVMQWVKHLPTLERLASLPGASATTRSLVLRLRSQLPAEFEFEG